ncbi:hypothetical protein ACH5RR_013135 [Cinchona calisaya]|uniref:DUF7588 domain-containing protein n=1 Tax=Cinchona calisaya TaxID=153742 RepID=A0ABD3A4W9_9GENT
MHGIYLETPQQVQSEPDVGSEIGLGYKVQHPSSTTSYKINMISHQTLSHDQLKENLKRAVLDFKQEKYSAFRNWFFSYYSDKQQKQIQDSYYYFIKHTMCYMDFFNWFYVEYRAQLIENNVDISVIELTDTDYVLNDGKNTVFKSIHPLCSYIKLGNSGAIATPFLSNDNHNNITQQGNFIVLN